VRSEPAHSRGVLALQILAAALLALDLLGLYLAPLGSAQSATLATAPTGSPERASEGGAKRAAATRRIRLKLGPEGRLLAARVAANEDSRPLRPSSGGGTSGVPTEDHLGILQVVATVAKLRRLDPEEALRRLAPRVAGRREATRRRQILSAGFPASGGPEPPPGWDPALDGDWSLHGPLWHRFRAEIDRAVREGFEPPCEGDPIAWGCALDDALAIRRGLCRLACGERNRFWARPGSACVLSAKLAAGE
jgi:hypothetical protein